MPSSHLPTVCIFGKVNNHRALWFSFWSRWCVAVLLHHISELRIHVSSRAKNSFWMGSFSFHLWWKLVWKACQLQFTKVLSQYLPLSLDSATSKFSEMIIFQHCLYVSLKTSIRLYQYKPVWGNRWKPSKLVPSNHKTCNILLFAKQNWLTKSEELKILQISIGLKSVKELHTYIPWSLCWISIL